MDELASTLDIDPIELRLRNASREGDLNADGRTLAADRDGRVPRGGAPPSPLHDAGRQGRGRRESRSHPGAELARRPLRDAASNPTAWFPILVGSPDISGSSTGLALIAAEAFGVSPEKVRVVIGDTSFAPQSPMAAGSQVTYSVGGAV